VNPRVFGPLWGRLRAAGTSHFWGKFTGTARLAKLFRKARPIIKAFIVFNKEFPLYYCEGMSKRDVHDRPVHSPDHAGRRRRFTDDVSIFDLSSPSVMPFPSRTSLLHYVRPDIHESDQEEFYEYVDKNKS
jgi:hypothetical protein